MVMGPTHAVSGAAAWLAIAPTAALVSGNTTDPLTTAVGTAVCAGSALAPDIDSPQSTVARSFGFLSVLAAHVVDAIAAGFYNLTKGPKDEPRTSGHRTLTHTAVFTVALGAVVAAVCGAGSKWAVGVVLFITLGLAIRGLMADWAKQQGWIVVTAASAAAAVGVLWLLPSGNYWWLGAAVAVGATMHLFGDMITKNGCPIIAPIPFRGRVWWEFTLPAFLRIRAGGWFEYTLLLPALTIATVWLAMNIYTPGLLTDLARAG